MLAFICGLYLIWRTNFDKVTWALLGAGAFFLLFYTWPLKYIALGEIAVFLVWGPLMVGGGYFVVAQTWDWNIVIASTVYALGVTTVIFGRHIDKMQPDREKHIHTLPSLLGERVSRYAVLGMMILPYLIAVYLVARGSFSPTADRLVCPSQVETGCPGVPQTQA